VDLNVEQQVERPHLTIKPKREMMAKYGITLPEFSEIVSTMLSGETVPQVYEEGKTFDLIVKVDDEYKDTAEKIKHLTIDANGKKIHWNM
jgi:Cu(I)/Ag(I) efflux system membrane protein CusA/SilA